MNTPRVMMWAIKPEFIELESPSKFQCP